MKLSKWPLIPLGDVLTERQETPRSEDLVDGTTRIVEKVSFASGQIQLRTDGITKTGMILIRPGDIVVSGINAAKGAVAIYDEKANEPVAATIHYGAYIPNKDRVNGKFLWWLLRSQLFQASLSEHVPGGIKTEMKAKRLLPVPVPIPPLPQQERILAHIEAVAEQISEARSLRKEVEEEVALIIKAALRELSEKVSITGKLIDVLTDTPRNGWSARCDNADDGNPVLSLGAVTGFHYRASEFKRTSLSAPPNGHFWLRQGDLLITRSNTPELVGHAAIYSGAPTPCIYPDLMMRIPINDALVDRRFVWYWLQSPIVREYIRLNAKGTSPTMKKISQGIVMNIPFPTDMSLADQRRAVYRLDALQKEISTLKTLQLVSTDELNALLPSVIDQAMNGGMWR
jgi:type I restriction enzyme S subunit